MSLDLVDLVELEFTECLARSLDLEPEEQSLHAAQNVREPADLERAPVDLAPVAAYRLFEVRAYLAL